MQIDNSPRISILGSFHEEITQWLTNHPKGHERGVIILFRRLSRNVNGLPISDRYLAFKTIILDGDWIVDSSPNHLTINMRNFCNIFFECERESLVLGFIHSHPNGLEDFSELDYSNENNILHGLIQSNGQHSKLISMIYVNEKWLARIRIYHQKQPISVKNIIVLSERIVIYGLMNSKIENNVVKRQEAAFGKAFNEKLQTLRAVVIGVGGTGSPMAILLARSGIGELILLDGDNLDITNMNRVSGFSNKSFPTFRTIELAL
jgi:hypothetical protein